MNPWLLVLAIITSYCGGYKDDEKQRCRQERFACVKASAGAEGDADIVDACLADPRYVTKKPEQPKTLPAPDAAKPVVEAPKK